MQVSEINAQFQTKARRNRPRETKFGQLRSNELRGGVKDALKRFPRTLIGSESYLLHHDNFSTVVSFRKYDDAIHVILSLGPCALRHILDISTDIQLIFLFKSESSHMHSLIFSETMLWT